MSETTYSPPDLSPHPLQSEPTPAEDLTSARMASSLSSLDPVGPMAPLMPLLNKNGELDIANLQLGERMAHFIALRERLNANLPLWETNLLTQFPAGTTLLPMPVIPAARDAWRGNDAKVMKLKDGHVEPSADFIIKVGGLLGVVLKKDFEGPADVEFDGKSIPMYSVRYSAFLTLPNGAVLSVEGEGKDQAMLTKDGSIQAHIVESTRKKAKRNAIKALVSIPTSMPEAEFDRPWILLRPVFHAGVTPETNRIIAEQAALSRSAIGRLYGDTIDVSAQEEGELGVEDVIAQIRDASDVASLDALAESIRSMRLTNEERSRLGAIFNGRKAEIGGSAA